MIGYLNVILRLVIWFLLTSEPSWQNIFIGSTISLLLPHNHKLRGPLTEWLRAFGKILVAVPMAYIEAFEMIFSPHNFEEIIIQRVPPRRSEGLVFLDILMIAIRPKTIVFKYRDNSDYQLEKLPDGIVLKHRDKGWYEIHRVCQK